MTRQIKWWLKDKGGVEEVGFDLVLKGKYWIRKHIQYKFGLDELPFLEGD
jgi:hypothetical protein